ncbi:MAG: hypothetical protein JW720_00740, partial [Sedimentisphaerales bacterium]|nr:hypothetical protein [Sedimentisphaerales bacterium]
MVGREKMRRVSRKKPCPVCDKPDWCLVAEDGSAAICQRIAEGSVKKCGDAGYLHILIDRHNGHDRHKYHASKRLLVTNIKIGNTSSKDFGQLANRYRQQLTSEKLNALANSLGVSAESLRRLNVGWDGNSYTFPMSNDFGQTIGIQRRFPNGRKVSVSGSKIGLFIPPNLPAEGILLICEGLTDTAAALDLGYAAIGRPNCNSRIRMVVRFVRGRDVVIVGDNDDAGKAGAEKLATRLLPCCPTIRIIRPPELIKDLRSWRQAGLTTKELSKVISATEPVKTTVRFKCTGKHM